MPTNNKKTSKPIASEASEILRNPNASTTAKKLAGSALSQYSTGNQTGSSMEDLASKVLSSEKYIEQTKK
ncbi:hypothetical protein QG516_25040 [Pedobacter gandavensis]|uniref:hypothetical protein n=1 Tax=Pedobacter TaxID=84567 RepID=UPI001C99BBC8|nr:MULTISPECIES: hypothetical protein [Pedobacter]WGQ09784.1 hypothetical protein QG516_25040 [Pedobacter gandavensis]